MLIGSTGCAVVPRVESPPELLRLPLWSRLVLEGERLTQVTIWLQCAGLTGIRHVPDGWTYRAEARGEDYRAEIVPPESEALEGYEAPPVLDIAFRGQWSDCYALRVESHYTTSVGSAVREFVQDGFRGKLLEVGR